MIKTQSLMKKISSNILWDIKKSDEELRNPTKMLQF